MFLCFPTKVWMGVHFHLRCRWMLQFNWKCMPCWIRIQSECINIIESKPSRIELSCVEALNTHHNGRRHLKKANLIIIIIIIIIINNNNKNTSSIDSFALRWLRKYIGCALFLLIKNGVQKIKWKGSKKGNKIEMKKKWWSCDFLCTARTRRRRL